MPIMDEVVLKIHKNGYFEFDYLRIKRNGGKTTKEGLRKKAKGKKKIVDDEPVGRKSVQTSCKGKEIMYEFLGPSPTKESQVSVTNYKRAIVKGKLKWLRLRMLVLFNLSNQQQRFRDQLRSVADELVLHDDWKYEGLVVYDVGGSSIRCDLLHENVVYNGHSLPNMDKERFSNNVVLDDVVTDTLAYT
nr:hypothetical protein [Tanacetum cinerariifolium]